MNILVQQISGIEKQNKKKKCENNEKKTLLPKTPNTKPIFEDRYEIIFVVEP